MINEFNKLSESELKYLYEQTKDNGFGKNKKSIFWLALESMNFELIQKLVALNNDFVNQKDTYRDQRPLGYIIEQYGRARNDKDDSKMKSILEIINFLVEHKVDPNELYYAISYAETYEIIELLLKNGAEVNTNELEGLSIRQSPFNFALSQARYLDKPKEIIQLFPDRGADVNFIPVNLSPLLTVVSQYTWHNKDQAKLYLELAKMLLDNGAKVQYRWGSDILSSGTIDVLDEAKKQGDEIYQLLNQYKWQV